MSKTKTKQTQTSTSTPTNPQWVEQPAQGLATNIQSLAGQDPKSFFAGASDLQDQGFDIFSGLGAQAPTWLNQAASMANPAAVAAADPGSAAHATAQSAAQNMGSYFNPFQQQVIDSTMGDLDRARQLTQNGNGQGAIASGQYGGSRQGVLDANADDSFLRNVGAMSGNLNMQGFNTAAGLGASDADRFTGVSQFNAGADNSMAALRAQLEQQAAMGNQDASLRGAGIVGGLGQYAANGLMDAGGVQQGLDQAQAGAPLTVQQLLSGSFASLPLGLFNGNTSTGTGTSTQSAGLGGILQGLGAFGQGLGSMGFSDARLKQDVRTICHDEKGRRWVEFSYIWEPMRRFFGVMAQEVRETDPDAVHALPSGFLVVDYAKLGVV